MRTRFDGQVVVVTGAGRGMGRSHALGLAALGGRVVVNDLPGSAEGQDAARAVVEEIVQGGGEAVASTADISTQRGCAEVVETAIESFGRIDSVIHNAGVASVLPVEEMTDAEMNRILRVHLYGAVNLTRSAWRHFVRQGGGSLLYISSAAGLYGAPGFSHYGPAKAGMLSLARTVSLEGRTFGIRANALAVAALTQMMRKILGEEETFSARSAELAWWEANMRPELTTPAALWLIHPECQATGSTFESRAGRVAKVFVAETRGYINPEHSIDDVREHFDEVENMDEWIVPGQSSELVNYESEWLAQAHEGKGYVSLMPEADLNERR